MSDELLQRAGELWGRGLSVIPIVERSKRAEIPWAEYQQRRPTMDEIADWFGNGRPFNIAIVCGKVSRVVAVDGDDADALAWMDAHVPPTPMRTKTRKGEHRFYQYDGPPLGNKTRLRTGETRLAIDVKADGGYVVAPGSTHETGVKYEQIGTWPPIEELPVFDPAWIAEPPIEPPPPRTHDAGASDDRRPGADFNRRASWSEVLEPHGWRRDSQKGGVTSWCRPGKKDGGSATTNHADSDLFYPWTTSTEFEAERGYSKFSVYAILNHGGDFKAAARALAAAGYGKPSGTPAADATRETTPHTFNLTDSGNAEYFAARHGPDVRRDLLRDRWLLWRHNRWQPDNDAEIRRLAKATMRQRFTDAATLDDADARRRAAKWAIESESRARLDALLYLTQAERPIADTGCGWDADSSLLGVPNGVVDLRTGILRPACREDRITLAAGVEYHADARSDLWDHAVRTILPDDGLIEFFHVAVGYSATGDTRRDCWFLGCGSGRNGKGTLLQPIRRALGDYALELPGSIFDLRAERSPYELAYLPGRRFVTSSESGDTLRLHHDRIKQLTGGDSISAANKYEKAFEFEPACKLWLACNKRPRTTDDTAAFWARVFLIPFTVSFVGKEDRSLRPALVQEPAHQAAVLAWIVRGTVRYYAEGLTEPPAVVRAATAAYREDSDPLGAFLSEACELEPGAELSGKELYEHYTHWANAQHFSEKERLSATMFGRHLAARFEHEHTRAGRVYRGLARRPL